MTSEGVWSYWTFCPARVNQGQCSTNRCPAKSLMFAGYFTGKCPARIQNVWQRTESSHDKISRKAWMNFAYTVHDVDNCWTCRLHFPYMFFRQVVALLHYITNGATGRHGCCVINQQWSLVGVVRVCGPSFPGPPARVENADTLVWLCSRNNCWLSKFGYTQQMTQANLTI